jgi:hypothetical protein
MSKATFTFGRFNPPTETGHGKLVSAVQKHAEETGGSHYVFPSHTQDAKKNPLSHEHKVGAMQKMFKGANVVSHEKVRTAIDAMKHLESKGHTHVTMVVGSDRVKDFHGLLNKYRKKEYPGIKKVSVVSAGHRDPDAEGAEGMSASKLRGLVAAGKKKEFVSHYSDPKLGAHIHDKVKAGMQMESVSPVGIFLLGGPGSGKDYVLNNIFSRFDLTEVQVEHILNGSAAKLIEQKKNIVINGALDEEKIQEVRTLLEGYDFDSIYVHVTNKVSRLRNSLRDNPLAENKRLEKWYRAEKLAETLESYKFNNSINLNESSDFEKVFFASEIEKLLERIVHSGLEIQTISEAKTFAPVAKHKSGLPKKYVGKLSDSTAAARKTHWKKMSKLSDKDPKAYAPAPGDATSKTKPSKHTIAVRKMMAKEDVVVESDKSLAAKAEKSGVSVGTLRKVFKRGVAAWNSGHRPGTTPQQWGHARVNSYINKGKTYHTADKDLREENLDELFEMQLVGTDEYRKHAIATTPGQKQNIDDAFEDIANVNEFKNSFKQVREKNSAVDFTPTLTKRKPSNTKAASKEFRYTMTGLPITSRLGIAEEKKKDFMPTPRQVPAHVPVGTKMIDGIPQHNVPKGFKRVRDNIAGYKLVKEEQITLEEAVKYHLENKISFTENVFRPGSEMFFDMIREAKRLYVEGNYTPADEWEKDMLETDIGEIAEFEGQQVVLDYPIEEGLEECWKGYTQRGMKKKGDKMVPNCVPVNEEDKTEGKGIGKPWREGGGGAVYVRTGDGGVKKVRFSQSGMKKKFMDPAATRSFVARHRCLTNKDKTSASYWACRYPRFFSNSGKIWW